MIVLDVEQGSTKWKQARLGIPTASQFSRIIMPSTLKLSKQADAYIYELAAEWILGEPCDSFNSAFMVRGSAQEDEAIRAYEFHSDAEVKRVGFCLRDDKHVGCSPDGLIADNGGLEIKCPSAQKHIGYLLGSPVDDYKAQVQGNLYITEREWWDVFSFNPFMPPALVRSQRDEKFIGALDGLLAQFLEKLEVAKERLRDLGVMNQPEPVIEEWPFEE